ncbi:MAG: InlB B-repeat-containing protein [Firmicutes bacterium]|nr:InlB B-repeat-containing protein [Bacillota bacterium]
MVNLDLINGNGGSAGFGGFAGGFGYGLVNGSSGQNGLNGIPGDSGTIEKLTGEEFQPHLVFNYNGGNVGVATKPVDYNSAFGTLPVPVYDGWKFVGWQNEYGSFVNGNTLFLALDKIELTAIYEKLYVINAHLNNGSGVSGTVFEANDFVAEGLPVPVRAGWAFDGWYLDSAFGTPLSATATAISLEASPTVYAKWLQEIRINFNITEFGSIINNEPASVLNNFNAAAPNQLYVIRVSGRPLGALPVARPNILNSQYYFGGWYENISNTSTLVAATTVYNHASLTNGQITLTSRWNTNAFLEYNLMGADDIDECSTAWDGGDEIYAGGTGTEQNPFQIANARQLRQLALHVNNRTAISPGNFYFDKHFILTNNIDLGTVHLWEPIGNGSVVGGLVRRFEGSFHGNGFYVKNLNIQYNSSTAIAAGSRIYLGLFGAALNAKITQVGIESGSITFNATGTGNIAERTHIYVGSVIGRCAGATLIQECYSNVDINVNVNRTAATLGVSAFVGGMVGRLDNGTSEGNVSSDNWGIQTAGSSFINSYFSGSIESLFNYNSGRVHNFVGGIVGYVYLSNFANVFNTGNINIRTVQTQSAGSTIAFAGGICGEINSGGNLANTFNTGTVSAHGQAAGGDRRVEVGGIVAHLNDSAGRITINGCKNTGALYLTRVGSTTSRNTTPEVNYEGDGLGGIIGLIVGTAGVTGINNQYVQNTMFFRTTASGSWTQYRNVGIDYYNNGSARTRPANTSNGAGGQYNGNHLIVGNNNLVAHGHAGNHEAFAFANNTDFFVSSSYFVVPSAVTNPTIAAPNVGRWNFSTVWEFRLDRNDNLPLLKYMSYLTEYKSGVLTPNRKYVYNGERVGRLITPLRTGYLFEGWWNYPVEFDPEVGGLAYNSIAAVNGQNGFIRYAGKTATSLTDTNSTVFVGLDNIQIYAGWMPILSNITFTVTLKGLSADDSISVYRGYAMGQLYDPVRPGYEFLGWFDSGNIRYYNTTVYALSTDLILTARWQANTYSIEFNAAGGFVSVGIIHVEYDSTLELLPIPYLFGHKFLGWKTAGGSTVKDGDIYKFDGNIVVAAEWELNTYQVIFDSNPASVAGTIAGVMTPQVFDFYTGPQDEQNLKTNAFSVTGYIFMGWALTPGINSNVVYLDGVSFKMDTEGDVTLYAVWRAETFFVRMDTRGGWVSNPGTLIREGAAGQRVSLPTPTKTGYDFAKWHTLVGGVETLVGNSIIISGNIDVYAKWDEITYTVSYNKNPGSGSTAVVGTDPTPGSIQTPGSLPLNYSAYSRTGYTFVGWALEPGGPLIYKKETNDMLHTTGLPAAYAGSNTLVLYAVWEPNVFILEFFSNAEAIDRVADVDVMASQSFSFDQPKNLFANQFAIIGLEFKGWATTSVLAKAGTVEFVNSELFGAFTTVNKLYAVWGNRTYVLEFRSGSQFLGTTISAEFDLDEQTDIILPGEISFPPSFFRQRNDFMGWALTASAAEGISKMPVGIQAAAMANGNRITLFAVWEPTKYTIVIKDETETETLLTLYNVPYGHPTWYYNAGIFTKTGYAFNGLAFSGGSVFITPTGFIEIGESYFDTFDAVKMLVAKHTPIKPELIGLSKEQVVYKQAENITILFSGVNVVFNVSSVLNGTVSINPQGVLSITATGKPGVDTVSFTVTATHTDDSNVFDTKTYEVIINKSAISIESYSTAFVYTGLNQQADVAYTLAGVDAGDNVKALSGLTFKQNNVIVPFVNAGTYTVEFVLAAAWAAYYQTDESCVFNIIISPAILTVTGNSLEKIYFTDNPDESLFESIVAGFVNGEDINIVVNYSTFCTKLSGVGKYIIYQLAEPVPNYDFKYENGYIEVKPVALVNAAIELQTGAGGYVEGGKLFFNLEDISFGADGEFTVNDFTIVWEYTSTLGGSWTRLNNEHDSQLILTSYKLGIDVAGLFFRVRIEGAGNIASDSNAASLVTQDSRIAAAPSAPLMPLNVLVTVLALFGLGAAIGSAILIICLRHKRLIARINLQNEYLGGARR